MGSEERKGKYPRRDIGIYTTKDTWQHKVEDGCRDDDIYCYWTLPRFGEIRADLEGMKFWVAFGGRWQGYFIIHETSLSDEDPCFEAWEDGEVRFWSESWHKCDGGERKPFQGFTYNVPRGD